MIIKKESMWGRHNPTIEYIKSYKKGMSKRLLALLEKDIELKYSMDDFKLLYTMLKGVSIYSQKLVIDELYFYLEYGSFNLVIDEPNYLIGEENYKTININMSKYLLINNRKLLLFLSCVPLNNVPKYIGSELGIYAEWRLQIHK